MQTKNLTNLDNLADQEILAGVLDLGIKEQELTAKLLLFIGIAEERKLFREAGFDSMYAFLTTKLHYSEPQAVRRLASARLIRTYPELYQLFLKKEVNLTTLSLVAKLITRENYQQVLAAIRGRSKREVTEFVAKLRPVQKVKEYVRPVSVFRESKALPLFAGDASNAGAAGSRSHQDSTFAGEGSSSKQNGISKPEVPPSSDDLTSKVPPYSDDQRCQVPLHQGEDTQEMVEFRFVLSAEQALQFNELQSLLSSKYPRGPKVAQVFAECLKHALERLSPRKRQERRERRLLKSGGPKPGAKAAVRTVVRRPADSRAETSNSQKRESESGVSARQPSGTLGKQYQCKSPQPTGGRERFVSKPLRDRIYLRDGGRCTYVASDGTRCNSRHDLEIDHIIPVCKGGGSDPGNLRLLCRSHNGLAAEQVLGKGFMRKHCIPKTQK